MHSRENKITSWYLIVVAMSHNVKNSRIIDLGFLYLNSLL